MNNAGKGVGDSLARAIILGKPGEITMICDFFMFEERDRHIERGRRKE